MLFIFYMQKIPCGTYQWIFQGSHKMRLDNESVLYILFFKAFSLFEKTCLIVTVQNLGVITLSPFFISFSFLRFTSTGRTV